MTVIYLHITKNHKHNTAVITLSDTCTFNGETKSRTAIDNLLKNLDSKCRVQRYERER